MQTQLETTLAKFISIPSVVTNPTACREIISFIQSEIAPLKLHVTSELDTPQPWLYATTRDTKKPDILLAAHLDVVPAPAEQFTMHKNDGKLYGRGVYDMKFAAACYLEFLKAHAGELARLNIGVLFTTDEEDTGRSILDVLDTGLRPKTILLPDGGDNWHIEKRAKGLYSVELIAHGKAAHGSRPWEGENALHTLLDTVQILRHKYPSTKPSDTTLSVNQITGGQAPNQIADYASVKIDFRSFSKADLANYKLLLAEMAGKHRLELHEIATGDPLLFDASQPNIQSFLETLKAFTGSDEAAFCESYGASDARFFAQYDIPCIIMEPNGGGRHAEGEWLLADDLEKYYRLIERWLIPEAAPIAAKNEALATVS